MQFRKCGKIRRVGVIVGESLVFCPSILMVLLLVQGPRKSTGDAGLDTRIDRALEKGTARLVEWLPSIAGDRQTLVLFAAFEGGADKKNPLVKAALEAQVRYRSAGTYATGIQLMLFRKHGGSEAREALKKAARRLLSWQGEDGGWGYGGVPKTRSDASCTQYALLGLRAAFQAGIRIPKRVVTRAVDYLLMTRDPQGGFGYFFWGRGGGVRDSLTAGTLGSLAICRELVGKAGLGRSREKKVQTGILAGLRWLEKAFPGSLWGGNVSMNRGYFLYALERAMVLLGMEKLGDVSWYAKGARFLVARQGDDGSWGDDPVTTAFAVLFLARTFRPLSSRPLSPVTRVSPEELLLRLREKAPQKEVLALAEMLARRGLAAVPACLKVLRGPSAARRRAAAMALERITGVKTSFDPAKDPSLPANQDAARVWERWWMEHRGQGKIKKGRRSK